VPLSMFHSNAWSYPLSPSIMGGTQVTLRAVRAKAIWQAIT